MTRDSSQMTGSFGYTHSSGTPVSANITSRDSRSSATNYSSTHTLASYNASQLMGRYRSDPNRNIRLSSNDRIDNRLEQIRTDTLNNREAITRSARNNTPGPADIPLGSRFYDHQDSFISGEVVRIIDADTIDVRHGNQTTRIRFAFIDAFESSQDPWGALATERLRELIPEGSTVRVQVDETQATGRFDRTIGQVYVGEQNINLQLVREGHAAIFRRYEIDPRIREALEVAELQARREGLNFWTDENRIMPWVYRDYQREGIYVRDRVQQREFERRSMDFARRYGAPATRVIDGSTFPTVLLTRGPATDYADMIAMARHAGTSLDLDTPVMGLSTLGPEDSRDVETLYQAKRIAAGLPMLDEEEVPEFIKEMDSRLTKYNIFEAINRWAYGNQYAQEFLNFGAVERYRKVVFSEPSMGSGIIKNVARGIGSRLDSYLNFVFNRVQPRGEQSSRGHETVAVAQYQRNMEGLFVSGAQLLTSMYTATMMYYGVMRPVEQVIGNLGAFSSASLIRATKGGEGFFSGLAKGAVFNLRQRAAENVFRQALGTMALDYLGFDLDIKTPENSKIGGPKRTLRTYTRYADFETQARKYFSIYDDFGLKAPKVFGVPQGYFIDKNTGRTLNFQYGGENRNIEFAVRDTNRLNKSLFVGDFSERIQKARGVAEAVNNIMTLIGLYGDTDTTFPQEGIKLYNNKGFGELAQKRILVKDGATRMALIQQNIQDVMKNVSANPLRWAGLELGGWLGADISFADLFGVEGVINRGISYAAGRQMYTTGGQASTVISGMSEMYKDLTYNTINRLQAMVAGSPLGNRIGMRSRNYYDQKYARYLATVRRSREIKFAQNVARNLGATSDDLKSLDATIKGGAVRRTDEGVQTFRELVIEIPKERRFGTRFSRLIATSVLTSWTISAVFANTENFYQSFADSWNWGNDNLLDGEGGLFNFTQGNLFNVGVFSRMAGPEGERDSWHVNWANAAVYVGSAGYAVATHINNKTWRNMMAGNAMSKRMALLSVPAVAGRAMGRAAVALAAASVVANRLGALNTWRNKRDYANRMGISPRDIDTEGFANFRLSRRLMEINRAGQENFGWLKTNMPIEALERAGVGNPYDAQSNASVRPTLAFQSGNLLMTSVAGIYSFQGQTNITSGIQLPMHTLGFGMILPFKLNFTGQDFVNVFRNRNARSSRLVTTDEMEAVRGEYSIYAAPYWSGALFNGRGVRMVYQPGTPMERLVMSYAMSSALEAGADMVSAGFRGVGGKLLHNTSSTIGQAVGHKLIGISTSIDDSLLVKGVKFKKKIEGLFLNLTLNQLSRGVVNNFTKLNKFIGYQSLRGANALTNKVFGAPVAPATQLFTESMDAAQRLQQVQSGRPVSLRERTANMFRTAFADPSQRLSMNIFADESRFILGTGAKFAGLMILSEAVGQGVFGVEGVGVIAGTIAAAYGTGLATQRYLYSKRIVEKVTGQTPKALIRSVRAGTGALTDVQASQISRALQDRAVKVQGFNRRMMRYGTIALGTGLIAAALASSGESTRVGDRPTGFLNRLYQMEITLPWGRDQEAYAQARRDRAADNNFFMNLLPYTPRRLQIGRAIALLTGGNRSYYTRQLRTTETNVYGETFVDPSMPFQMSSDRPDGGPGFFDTFFGSIDAINGSAYAGQTMEPGFHAGVAGIAARDFDGGYQAASTYTQFQRPLSDISFALGVVSGSAEAGFMTEYISSVRRIVENREMTDPEKYLAITLGKSRALAKPRTFSKFMHSQSTRAVGGNRVISSTLAQRQQYLQWMRNATPLDLLTWSSRDRGAASGMREIVQNASRQGEGKATVASLYSAISGWLGGGTYSEELYGFDPAVNQLGEYDDNLQLLTNMGLYDRETRLGSRGVLTGRDVNMGLVGATFGVLGGGAAVYLTAKSMQYGIFQTLGINAKMGVNQNIRALEEMRTSLLSEVVQGVQASSGARHIGAIPRNIKLSLVRGSASNAIQGASASRVNPQQVVDNAIIRAWTGQQADPTFLSQYRVASTLDADNIDVRRVQELGEDLNSVLQNFKTGVEKQINSLDDLLGEIKVNVYDTSGKQILTARNAIRDSLVKFREAAISGSKGAALTSGNATDNMKLLFGSGTNFDDIVKGLNNSSRGQIVADALEEMSKSFTHVDAAGFRSISGFDYISKELDELISILDEPTATAKTVREGMRRFTLRAREMQPFLTNILERPSKDFIDVAMRSLDAPTYRLLEGGGIDALSFNQVSNSANARTVAMSNAAATAMDDAAMAATRSSRAADAAASMSPRMMASRARQFGSRAFGSTMENLVDWQVYGAGFATLGTGTKYFNTRFDSAEVSHALAEDTFRVGNMIVDNVAWHQVLGQGGLIRSGVMGFGKVAAGGFNAAFGLGGGAGAAGGAAGAGGIGAAGALGLIGAAALLGYTIWSMSARKGAIWEAHVARRDEGYGAMFRSLTNSAVGAVGTVFEGYETAKSAAARFFRIPQAREAVGNFLYDRRQDYLDALAGRSGPMAQFGANVLYQSTERVSNFIEDVQVAAADGLDRRIRTSDGVAQWGWSFLASNLYSLGLVNPLDDVTNISNSNLVNAMRSSAMPDMTAEETAAAQWHAQLQDLQTFSVPNLLSPFHAGHMDMHPYSVQGVQMRQRTSPMGANGRAFGANFSMTRRVNAVEQGALRDRGARLQWTYGQIAYYSPAVARTNNADVRDVLGLSRSGPTIGAPGGVNYGSNLNTPGHAANVSVDYEAGPIEGMSAAEYDLLQRLVLAEAQTEGTVGMAAVARSIANRTALVQSGTLTPGTYNAVGGSWDNIMRARGQYQPFSDGRINIAWTEEQLEQAREAIALGLNVEEFRDVLVNQLGIDATQAETIVDATGFRTAYAFNDSSQNFNRITLGNHVFNSDRFASQLDPSAIAETTLRPSVVRSVTSTDPHLSVTAGGERPTGPLERAHQRPEVVTSSGSYVDRHDNLGFYNTYLAEQGIDLRVNSGFGMRWGRLHRGVDIPNAGVPFELYTPYENSKVTYTGTGYQSGYGNNIIIQELNDDGVPTGNYIAVAHLHSINVNLNQILSRGDLIGFAGNTGASTGLHLHLEERVASNAIEAESSNTVVPPRLGIVAGVIDNSRNYLSWSEPTNPVDQILESVSPSNTTHTSATNLQESLRLDRNSAASVIESENNPVVIPRQQRLHPLGRVKTMLTNLFHPNIGGGPGSEANAAEIPDSRPEVLIDMEALNGATWSIQGMTQDARRLEDAISEVELKDGVITNASLINAKPQGHRTEAVDRKYRNDLSSGFSQHLNEKVEQEQGDTRRNIGNVIIGAIAFGTTVGFGHQVMMSRGQSARPTRQSFARYMTNRSARGYIRLGPLQAVREAMPTTPPMNQAQIAAALYTSDGNLKPFTSLHENMRAAPEIQALYRNELVRDIVRTIDPSLDLTPSMMPEFKMFGAGMRKSATGSYSGFTNTLNLNQQGYMGLFVEARPSFETLETLTHELTHAAIDSQFGRYTVADPNRKFIMSDSTQATLEDIQRANAYADRIVAADPGANLNDPRIYGSSRAHIKAANEATQAYNTRLQELVAQSVDYAEGIPPDTDFATRTLDQIARQVDLEGIPQVDYNEVRTYFNFLDDAAFDAELDSLRNLNRSMEWRNARMRGSMAAEAQAFRYGHMLNELSIESYKRIYGVAELSPSTGPAPNGVVAYYQNIRRTQPEAWRAQFGDADFGPKELGQIHPTKRAAWLARQQSHMEAVRASEAVTNLDAIVQPGTANPHTVVADTVRRNRVSSVPNGTSPMPNPEDLVAAQAVDPAALMTFDSPELGDFRFRTTDFDIPTSSIAAQTDEMAAVIRATTNNFEGLKNLGRASAPYLEWAGTAADFVPLGLEMYNQSVVQSQLTTEERLNLRYRNNQAMAEAGAEAAVGIFSGALVTTGVGAVATAYGLGAPVTVPATIVGTIAVSAVTSKPAREAAGAVGRTVAVHQTTMDQAAHVRHQVFEQMDVAPTGRVDPSRAPVRISQLSVEERRNRNQANRVVNTIVTRARDDMRDELQNMTDTMAMHLADVRRQEMETDLARLEAMDSTNRGAHIREGRLRRALENGNYLTGADREFIEQERRRAEEYWTTHRDDPGEALEATREYARTRTQEFIQQADRYQEIAPERARLQVNGVRLTPDRWNPVEPTTSRNEIMVQMIRQGVLTREDESAGVVDAAPEAAATAQVSPQAPQRVQVVVPPSEQNDLTHELGVGQTDTMTRDIPHEQPRQSLEVNRSQASVAGSTQAPQTEVQVVTTVNQSQATVVANTDTAQVCSVEEDNPGLWGRMTGWLPWR